MFDFKRLMTADLDVFLNLEEFAEPHSIDGKTVQSVFDAEAVTNQDKGNNAALSRGMLQLFAKASELPYSKDYGESINIDGVDYLVEEWDTDAGLAIVTVRKTFV